MPTRPKSGAREYAFLFLFPGDNHLCKGIMLQLEGKKRNSVSLVAPFKKIGGEPP